MNRYFYYLAIAFFALASRQAFSSGIKINEVLSSNAYSLFDDCGNTHDWIELYNSTDQPVNLKGYRIFDRNDISKAWVLPDTVIMPGSFLVLYASGLDTLTSGKFAIESSGFGIYEHARWDGFRFDYLELNGDFDLSVEVSSIRPLASGRPHAGLVIKEGLDDYSHYVGLFYMYMDLYKENWYWYAYRDSLGMYPNYQFPGFRNQNKPAWLRMRRKGDSVYTYCEDAQGYVIESHSNYFPVNPVYAGIGTASTNDTVLSRFTFQNLRLNGNSISFMNLQETEINTKIKGRIYSTREMHTNFKLDDAGETLYLWDANGNLEDNLSFGHLQPDVSFGRYPDGSDSLRCFRQSTPFISNLNSEPYQGIMPSPSFSTDGGWFSAPVSMNIINNGSADKIYFTTDGSEPNDKSAEYKGQALNIDSNTIVRAVAYKKNYLQSDIITRTFFINDSSSLPVVSIAVAPADMHNNNGSGLLDLTTMNITVKVNYEYFEANKLLGYSSASDMRITGNTGARLAEQPSLRFDARKYFGNNEFKYNFFGSNSLKEYETVVLRNSSSDWSRSFMRDAFGGMLARRMPTQVGATYQPVLSFVNGKFFGLYNLREHINESYLADKFNIPEDSINVYKNVRETTAGSANSYKHFISRLEKTDVNTLSAYEFVDSNLDIDNLLDYTILSFYTSNVDWPNNSIKQWSSGAFDKKWRYVAYDFDQSFANDFVSGPDNNLVKNFFNLKDSSGYEFAWMFDKLLQNDTIRIRFINRTADLLNSVFMPEPVIQLLDSMKVNIAKEVPRQKQLRPGCLVEYEESYKNMVDYANTRPGFLRKDIVEKFALSGIARLKIKTSNGEKVRIRINSLSQYNKEFGGLYFKDVPIEIELIAGTGAEFFGWSDKNLPKKTKITIVLTDSLDLTAYFNNDNEIKPLVINEIMYKPDKDKDCRDWFELFNPNKLPLDLQGYKFSDDDNSHSFVFPHSTIIGPEGYLVVAEDTAIFRTFYSGVGNVTGTFSFGIGKSDQVRLYDNTGLLVDSVSYSDKSPWPENADGTGFSIELNSPGLDNNQGKNWHSSSILLGTPGEANSQAMDTGDHPLAVQSGEISLYPNPADDFLFIGFNVESDAEVEISVSDMLGSKLILLANKPYSSGRFTEKLDIRNLSKGVYFLTLRINASGRMATRTISFVKA